MIPVPTEHLFELVEELGLALEWTSRLPHDIFGLYIASPDTAPVIALSKDLLTRERQLREVLAEEIGHHLTAAGNFICLTPCRNRPYLYKLEKRALSWATETLAPTDVYLQLLERGYRRHEMADYFCVTELFLSWKELLCNSCAVRQMLSGRVLSGKG